MLRTLTVKVLEVGELDALAHAQHVRGRAEAVDQHPDVSRVESRDLVGCLASQSISGVGRECVGDVSPCRNDGAEDHKAEAQQGHACDGSAEPQHLAVCDQDDGQVLEDGVDGDAQELQRLAAGVDHADQQEGDGEPFPRLVGVEVAELCNAHGLECLDCYDADDALYDVLSAGYSYSCSCCCPSYNIFQERTWTAKRKKLRLKLLFRTYLLVTVMRMLLPQYARIDMGGLLDRAGAEDAICCGLGAASKVLLGCLSPSSTV
jgi:hypothetical protein